MVAVAVNEQKTRRLARKQMGWFGRDARIHWLDALRPDLAEAALAIVDDADAGEFDCDSSDATEHVTQHHLGDAFNV